MYIFTQSNKYIDEKAEYKQCMYLYVQYNADEYIQCDFLY